ncbi:transcriptional repressor LexA [Paenibacillus glucanolyticus]|jgi:repressor LexA|uniref:LexA repressor n=1 Tax=Paenibacillus glucanolyticus TaxID=59843 RepID=A0A168EWG4_9BACL|nr:transcriptional repressor LexA [Paenibacillus glucanolyticus]KZS44893.1 repressor LexA [Paenibacillus glucanolyticus]OMF65559.1 repressor LexA [Paenibacillus glucanolyticus]
MLHGTQAKVYEFLKKHAKLRGYPPSVREIGEALGLCSSSTVHGHLERLEKKGFIRRDPSKPRAIELIQQEEMQLDKSTIKNVPLIGKVTAGTPIEAFENIEEFFPVPINTDGTFFLTVKGDSMQDAGIHNGDYVLVKKQTIAENGDIVVAKTPEGEVTVKKFYLEEKSIRLQPCNKNYKPMYFDSISVIGKVVGLFRFSMV